MYIASYMMGRLLRHPRSRTLTRSQLVIYIDLSLDGWQAWNLIQPISLHFESTMFPPGSARQHSSESPLGAHSHLMAFHVFKSFDGSVSIVIRPLSYSLLAPRSLSILPSLNVSLLPVDRLSQFVDSSLVAAHTAPIQPKKVQHGLVQVCRYFRRRSKLGGLRRARRVEHRLAVAGDLLGWVCEVVYRSEGRLIRATFPSSNSSNTLRWLGTEPKQFTVLYVDRALIQIEKMTDTLAPGSLSNPDVNLLTSKLALTAVSAYSCPLAGSGLRPDTFACS
jgi:hypothetical protein